MIYKEDHISEKSLLEVTAHNHYYINPYFGCSEKCPFCYWTVLPGWEGQITARTNIIDCFREKMKTWDRHKRICFGSYCNPYESIEKKYRLTRGLLEVTKEYGIPFMLTTSSSLIIDDIDLIESMKSNAIIVFELSRIDRLQKFSETGEHDVLDTANEFNRRGIKVLATVSPYLKGITDIDQIMGKLDSNIDIYIGCLDLETNHETASRLLQQIQVFRPDLLSHYNWLLEGNNAYSEFTELTDKYAGIKQIKQFPLEIQYDV